MPLWDCISEVSELLVFPVGTRISSLFAPLPFILNEARKQWKVLDVSFDTLHYYLFMKTFVLPVQQV